MSKASKWILLGSLGLSCQKQNSESSLKNKLLELYIIHENMLVCSKEKYFKPENLFERKNIQHKASVPPHLPNLHFSLVHQENVPYSFYEFTNPQHIAKSPRGNIYLHMRSQAIVLRPMGRSYGEADQILSQCKRGLRGAIAQWWKRPRKK